MNVLVVGGGGREHAITATIAQSRKDPVIFAVMAKKNPGISRLCQDFLLEKETDVKKIVAYAAAKNIDLAFIGPEAPLAAGLADALEDIGVGVVGPRKAVSKIEFDKAWARSFMRKHGIGGCPVFEIFTEQGPMFDFIAKLGDVAIKPSGLTGGKGVKVMGDQLPSVKDAQQYAAQILGSGSVVVEEKLVGEEFTLQAFVDGEHLAFSPSVQDHKRAFENDLGPNTGGMGSYTDAGELLPFLRAEDVQQAKDIMQHTVTGLYMETGVKYKGVLYGQFMVTRNGLRVIEFNARFGDPEAMNVLPLLETDIVDVMSAVVGGTLDRLTVKFSKKATVCKYAVPAGYPDNPSKDKEVSVGDVGDALVFYASVYEENGRIYTTGSRAIAVVGIDVSIPKAEKKAQDALDNIIGDLHSRRDIGTMSLVQKRIDHMNEIRG
ncbi:phosphoribosylamine--glycine ligase [Methanomethylovorans sp.]|uniref:phosphoribosylamine--glycine ligase n=1 Tax=Methanomethylovorans sp. TaxID=2758717 RepID=UPI000A9384BA|nr:phosphoribosylamine--glycine ligase [Methanomethylovorans sp.]